MKIRLYLTTALLSAVAYTLGLFAARELSITAFSPPAVSAGQEGAVLFLFLALFASATGFLLLLFRVYRGTGLYRLLFSLVVFLGLLKLFETVFPLEFSVIVAALFLLGFFLVPTVWTHDVIVILASAGIGAMFALSFTESTSVALLAVLSIYDVLAVFVTKHMITLAHAMIRSQATFALFIPERIKEFAASIAQVRPGAGFMILGGGDIVLPMIYLSVVAREQSGVAIVGMCGALCGQFLNHLFLVQLRKPIPALPMIALGAIAGVAAGNILL